MRILLTTSSLSFLLQWRDEVLAELRPMAKLTLSLLSLSVLFLTGCLTIGPRTVARDRFDYSTAISESWKRQTLLNLIKIRLADAARVFQVTSILQPYALQNPVRFGLAWLSLPPGDGQVVT